MGLWKKYCSTVAAAMWFVSAVFYCSQVCAGMSKALFGPKMEAVRYPS